jgi:hypothetical protein
MSQSLLYIFWLNIEELPITKKISKKIFLTKMIILASPLTYLFRFLGTVLLGDEIHHITAGETLYKK